MTTHRSATIQGSGGSAESLVLSVREAAVLLGISKDLAYELVRTGDIPSVRFGRRVLVPKRQLVALVEGAVGSMPSSDRTRSTECFRCSRES